ncbi:MAG: hypothetical protein HY461_01580 [Parcubacteria group bacterium]|nr:hypothetical protein [Parcubacteria group bacterium]
MQKRFFSFDWFVGLLILGVIILAADMVLAARLFTGGAASSSDELAITLLTTPNCTSCFDLAPLRDYLTQNGVEESRIREVVYDSREGKKLVKTYSVTKVPTAVMTGPHAQYPFLSDLVGAIAEIRKEALVLTTLQPPYLDLDEQKVKGEFEVVYVVDATCTECYDVTLHETVMERMAMTPTTSSTIDINSEEGKILVEEYVLTAVPTVLFRGDLELYESLQEIWSNVGTIEDDGTYVLRQGVSSMGAYKQLPSGELITPAPVEEAAPQT